MRSLTGAVVVSLVILATLVGCGGRRTPDRGTVSGTFVAMGGPAPVNGHPMRVVPLPGRIIATNSAGRHVQVAVGGSGKFRLSLPPGTYRLIGYSPRVLVNQAEMRCRAIHPVHVTAARSLLHVKVICSV